MSHAALRLALMVLFVFALSTAARPMSIEIGGGEVLVAVGDAWRYFPGTEAPSDPADAWSGVVFDDSLWAVGPSGFGYDDDDDATVLDDMEDRYPSVYIRKELTLDSVPEGGLVLEVDFDDGFIAYLNGVEVVRENMPAGDVDHDETADDSHEAGSPEYFSLGAAADHLVIGTNVLAIEGHNRSLGSSDFSLIPSLSVGGRRAAVRDGDAWIVGTATISLQGETSAGSAVEVEVGGVGASSFDAGTGLWSTEVTLVTGTNTILVDALDSGGGVVDSGTIEILYVPAENRFSGSLSEDITWSGAVEIEATLTVPAEVSLTVAPGTTVMFHEGASLLVHGELRAGGTEELPIRFTHHGDGSVWGRMMFLDSADSRIAHATVEFSDCEGAHQDYYEEGPRSYHEAIVVLASHLDVDSCLFRNMPDDSSSGEGDVFAVISDDEEYPGVSTANFTNCRFIGVGQGIHTRFSPVRVEGCYFTGHHGDNDDVDLWGESDPAPLIIGNLFEAPDHDDAINPTKCSAVIIGNVIRNTDDHGIVLRGRCSPILINNIVADCASGGIAIENACTATLINNTIYDCRRGLRLFDLGRWGPPYRLEPGGGTATVINCIVWDCQESITLADSDSTDVEDQGSHITVIHSLIDGGEDGISVSGSDSTVTWGAGNLDADPLFVDPANYDFRLQAGSPAIDVGTRVDAPPDDLVGSGRPCGEGVDLGAYEAGDCGGGPSRFSRGETNGDGRIDVSDVVALLRYLFAGSLEPACLKAADADDSGEVNVTDATRILHLLFQGGPGLSAPYPGCDVDPTKDELSCESSVDC